MSVISGEAVAPALVSKAHCCLAPSIWRRLLMQAFCCAVLRARTQLGTAIVARRPIIITTIMISTSVNADWTDAFVFIVAGRSACASASAPKQHVAIKLD